jgi:hypothetical protein
MGAVTSSKYMCIAFINIHLQNLGPLCGPENITAQIHGHEQRNVNVKNGQTRALMTYYNIKKHNT